MASGNFPHLLHPLCLPAQLLQLRHVCPPLVAVTAGIEQHSLLSQTPRVGYHQRTGGLTKIRIDILIAAMHWCTASRKVAPSRHLPLVPKPPLVSSRPVSNGSHPLVPAKGHLGSVAATTHPHSGMHQLSNAPATNHSRIITWCACCFCVGLTQEPDLCSLERRRQCAVQQEGPGRVQRRARSLLPRRRQVGGQRLQWQRWQQPCSQSRMSSFSASDWICSCTQKF